MINLNSYKNHLINHYIYPYDNSIEKRLTRKVYLERQYSDEDLSKIIDDSYSFIREIFNEPTIDNNYCLFELEDDTTEYISLNLVGGHHSDTLYRYNDKTISKYILNRTFGDQLIVDIKEDLYDFDTGDDIMSFDHRFSLYLQGFPKNMSEIKNEIFGNNKVLKK